MGQPVVYAPGPEVMISYDDAKSLGQSTMPYLPSK